MPQQQQQVDDSALDPSVFEALAELVRGNQSATAPVSTIPRQKAGGTPEGLLNQYMQSAQVNDTRFGSNSMNPVAFPSAAGPSWPAASPSGSSGPSNSQMAGFYSEPFKTPFTPNRMEAPQNPGPMFPPQPQSYGNSPASQPSTSSQAPPDPFAHLPPIPAGFSIDQLTQYGSAGLEMAIRVGMGIGMSLGQQAQSNAQSSQAPSTAVTETTPSSIASPSQPKAPAAKPRDLFSDILKDNLFKEKDPLPDPRSVPLSRRPSREKGGSPTFGPILSPEEAAKKDPLATQVWKAYAQHRESLPNGARMENLTWRLMHLTLKKIEEPAQAVKEEEAADELKELPEQERGRSKGKSRVVGFGNVESPE